MEKENKSLKELTDLYLEEVGKKYHSKISVRNKEESKLLKILRPFVQLFNKGFWASYVTTIGHTIWVHKDWFDDEKRIKSKLVTTSHEVIHVAQVKKWSAPLFSFLYLFPQSMVVFTLLSFLAIPFSACWLLCLLFFLFLLPLPAPFRFMFELQAYRTRVVFTNYYYSNLRVRNAANENNKKEIVKILSGPSYYFTWPFKTHVMKCLNKNSELKNDLYKEIEEFLARHDVK